MKKSLVALAVLAATGAFAQSSVTLYGRLDLGMGSGQTKTTPAGGLTTTTKTTELAGGENNWTGSRLGVRGSEDLGGGLKANFAYEFRLAPDAVTAAGVTGSNFGRTRSALLQVAGGFGSVTIGTYLNPFDDIRLGAGIYGGSTPIPGAYTLDKSPIAISGRSSNSIGYRSPVFAGGFTASIGTTNQRTETSGPQTAGTPSTQTSGYIGSLGYANGPINVLAAYGAGKVNTTSTDGAGVINAAAVGRVKDFAVKASYDLGVAVPYLQYENVKATAGTTLPFVTTGDVRSRGFELGSTFPMGAFTPYVLVANNKFTPSVGSVTKISAFQLGTKYDLSKRTFVYGGFGASTRKIALTSEAKSTGYGLGLVHNF